jgi:hypothetical protein
MDQDPEPTPDTATPDAPTTDGEWRAFEDMLASEPGSLALSGWRIVVFVDKENQSWLRWSSVGDPSLDETVAALTRTAFLVQHYVQKRLDEGDEPEDD